MIITCLFSKYFQILYILPKSSNNLLFLNIYLPFFWKIAAIPLLSKIDPVRCFVKSSLAFSQLQNMLTYFTTILPRSTKSSTLIQCTQKPDSQFTEITSDWSQCDPKKNNSKTFNSAGRHYLSILGTHNLGA